MILTARIVGVALLVVSCSASMGTQGTNQSQTVFDVTGMSSPMCELAITTVVGSMTGVQTVDVSLEHGEVKAVFDASATSASRIASTINSLGFRATVRGESAASEAKSAIPAAGFCEGGACIPTIARLSGATPEEVEKVVDFAAGYIAEKESIPTGREVVDATGVSLTRESLPFLQQAVLARLLADPKTRTFLEGSRCNDYGACSLHRNLINAEGEELEMYFREKAEDGQVYEDRDVPRFEAFDLDGQRVSSTDLTGQPTLLAFLALHCIHSTDSIPILAQLRETLPVDVRIVAVVVNSVTPEEAEPLLGFHWPQFKRQFETWVYDDPKLGDIVESHLVPTYLLVDTSSKVVRKLVGFKKYEELVEATAILE